MSSASKRSLPTRIFTPSTASIGRCLMRNSELPEKMFLSFTAAGRNWNDRQQKYGQRTQKTGSASPSQTLWSGRPSPTDRGSRGGVERYLGFRGRRRNSLESTRTDKKNP